MTDPKLSASPPSGMRDLLPAQVEIRERAIDRILEVYRAYGFVRIETPAIESLRLLLKSDGGENEKLIYKILKRGEKLAAAAAADQADLADLGLRFDLTVPLARYYANNQGRLPHPFRAIQIGSVWRAERAQKGRFRQFTQCDIDIIGAASSVAEIELIAATTEALARLGLGQGMTVRLNDRRILGGLIRHCGFRPEDAGAVFVALDKLDKIGRAGIERELAEHGHAGPPVARLFGLLEGGARSVGAWRQTLSALVDGAVWDGLEQIIAALGAPDGGAVAIGFDPTLVRGMGYYTGPIFEIAYAGYASSVAGGGRYDDLIGKLTGRPVPATGFSIGFERIVSILEERGPAGARTEDKHAILVERATPALEAAVSQARALRGSGRIVVLEEKSARVGKQLFDLAQQGFTAVTAIDATGTATDLTGELAKKTERIAGERRP
ncbi:MAG: histidine--tRNA ligase [Candidatus Rokubacteria bacterium]|nr:histidine--tRNA ligase [Candidatus Rokubacteria bacterium]MBI3824662.1 histidine--tRNA ligase [Candidatus Rokubacteria bacterium]